MRVIVNSTPLIALSLIDQLDLLRQLFEEVVVPTSVYQEIVLHGQGRPGADAVAQADWIQICEPGLQATLPPILLGLDQGEMDVLLLARELQADLVLIDEKLGRRIAGILGLRVQGTLGVLLRAYRKHLISQEEAEAAVQRLAHSSVRVSPRLIQWFREQLTKGTSTE